MVVTVKSMREAADAYEDIDWDALLSQVDVGTMMGDRSGFVWNQPPTNNYVDDLVYRKLQRVKIAPGELCTDEEFVRRVYLDLTGLPPTADEVRAFLATGGEPRARRDALIDQLLGSPAYVEFWTNKWSDMLQVNRKFLGEAGAVALQPRASALGADLRGERAAGGRGRSTPKASPSGLR